MTAGDQLERLHTTLGKMELALGSINEAIAWTDENGHIQWCNAAFDRLAGKAHILILGRVLTDVLPLGREGGGIGPGQHPMELLMAGEIQVSGLYELYREKEVIYVEIAGSRVVSEEENNILILSLKDVTELTVNRRALEKAKLTLEERVTARTRQLESVSDQYRAIFSEVVDAIITINTQGVIQSFNPAAEKIFGYTRDEAVGQNVTLIIPEPHKQHHHTYIKNYLKTGKRNVIGIGREVEGLHKSGRMIPLYLGVSEVRLKDQILFTGVLRDISEQKAAEAALKTARDAAESSNKAKSIFLANMSHEIRTPLNAVLGFSELLIPITKGERPKQYLDAIISSGKGLLTIINDILDLSKIEAGKLDLIWEPVDLGQLLEEIRQIFIPGVRAKGIEVELEIGPELLAGPGLILDEIRLRQILLNLAGNAVKFTHKGRITLGAQRKGQDLWIRVKDTGIGIPLERQEAIFKAFEQQEGDTARTYGGTGLGLTITRRLVRMMKGGITLESHPGQGSEFTVILKDVSLADPVAAERVEPEGSLNAFAQGRILVVDDTASSRSLIREMLAGKGLVVEEACDGEQGLAMAKKIIPDLIILDLHMPGIDGHGVLAGLKQKPALSKIPVICISASVAAADQDQDGFDLFLPKPLSQKRLLSGIGRFLKRERDKEGLDSEQTDLPVSELDHILTEPEGDIEKLIHDLGELGPLPKAEGVLEMDRIQTYAEALASIAGTAGVNGLKARARKLAADAAGFDVDRVRSGLISISREIEKTGGRDDS